MNYKDLVVLRYITDNYDISRIHIVSTAEAIKKHGNNNFEINMDTLTWTFEGKKSLIGSFPNPSHPTELLSAVIGVYDKTNIAHLNRMFYISKNFKVIPEQIDEH